MILIDIFIINYFCASDTVKAIESLGPNPKWHYWILDNSNSDTEWSELKKQIDALTNYSIHYERSANNIGFGCGCNVLFRKSSAPFCLLLNPDARINKSGLEELVFQLQKNSKYAAVAPLIRWIDKEQWFIPSALSQSYLSSLAIRLINLNVFIYSLVWHFYYKKQQELTKQKGCVLQSNLSGAILLLSRASVLSKNSAQKNLFDENYFMFFEDADLCLRLRKNNMKIGIVANVVATHRYIHSANKNKLMRESHEYFCRKWYPKIFLYIIKFLDYFKIFNAISSDKVIRARSHLEFNEQLNDSYLIAWSPSPIRIPSIWRCKKNGHDPGFSQSAWESLAPGIYYGVTVNQKSNSSQYLWICFEKEECVGLNNVHNYEADTQKIDAPHKRK